MTDQTWEHWRERLAHELATLDDGEFVVLGEPTPEPAPRRGLLRRRPDPPPTRFVQFLHAGDGVIAECVGATSFGGYVDIAPADHERLRALGWKAPGDTSDVEWGAPNYRLYAAPDDGERLAQLATDSLQVLGLAPDTVALTRAR
ncbi:MAG: TY-Chap domain-containing protein [Actinomycetes bacterium]